MYAILFIFFLVLVHIRILRPGDKLFFKITSDYFIRKSIVHFILIITHLIYIIIILYFRY